MLKIIINTLLKKLGKKDYRLDSEISSSFLFILSFNKFFELIRGGILKLRLRKSEGFIFLGKRSKVYCANNIVVGKTLTIGKNVTINGLCKEGVEIGNNVSILDNTTIECTGVLRNIGVGLKVGDNVGFAQNCFIQVRGRVIIGNNVIFGPYAKIFSENHNFVKTDVLIKNQGETRLPVTIEDDVWIGTNTTILGGILIGEGSVVAANSLVNKDVEPYSVVGGVPAKLIKYRK